jgi:hypothetical protein
MSLWPDPKPGSPRFIATYGLVVVLALTELLIAWWAIHPNVPEEYRAYYIDQTTTCMRQSVTGAYRMGTTINFRSGGDDTRELRPCGWEGPTGDGMHALGETARLRFATGTITTPMLLTLQMTAVDIDGMSDQRVAVSANGVPVGTTTIPRAQSATVPFTIPAGLTAQSGLLDIVLDFPDAVRARAGDSNTRKRSIKLTEATLTPEP